MNALFRDETTTLVEQRPLSGDILTPTSIIAGMIERGQDPQPMMAIFREWEDRIAAEAYGHALAAFQAKCPRITKKRRINLGSGEGPLYASLDDIDSVIKPILAEFGLSIRYTAEMTADGRMHATCFIRHGRHEEASEVTLPVPTQMRVNDTQKMGAALSYAKRYALCSALNIVVTDEDTDAAGVMETIDQEQIATLEEWIESSGADRARFLKRFEIDCLANMPAQQFLVALGELKRKAAQRK